MQLNNFDILNAFVAFLSFLIFFIHWMSNKKPSLPNFLFRFFLLANAYYFIVAAMIQNESILTVPHLFRTASIAGLLATPLVYLILIKSLKNEPWKKIDYLHFVPAILYIIDFMPFFILPKVRKLEVLENLFENGDAAMLGFDEGLIFNGTFWIVCKVLQPLIYSVFCFITLNRTVGNSGNSFKTDNKRLILFLYWLSAYLLLNTIPIALSFADLTGSNGWKITSIILFSSTLITCLFLLFTPEVLYGLKGIWIITQNRDDSGFVGGDIQIIESGSVIKNKVSTLEGVTAINELAFSEKSIRETYLSVKQVENMERVISKYMHETKAFLKQGFSLPQLAKETGFQSQYVSAFLNQHLGDNFNDYINKFRVNHLISLFEQDRTIVDQFTLEFLAKESGFGSRSAFNTFFKKFKGQTPTSYFKPEYPSK